MSASSSALLRAALPSFLPTLDRVQPMSWDHGYYSNAAYTSGYYREMATGWIDLACLLR